MAGARRTGLVCLALLLGAGATAGDAVALEGVEWDDFVGGVVATSSAGCEPDHDENYDEPKTPAKNLSGFSLSGSTTSQGSCLDATTPDVPDDRYPVSAAAQGSATGTVVDTDDALRISVTGSSRGSWAKTRTFESHNAGANPDGYGYLYFEVTTPVPYRITGSVATSFPDAENSGGSASAEVTLELDGNTVPGARAGRIEAPSGVQEDVPSVSQSGVLDPGTYLFQVWTACDTVALRKTSHECSADATGTLQLGTSTPPIVFVHGFAGSRLYCGAEELWLPLGLTIPMDRLRLAADGQTDAPGSCPAPIGPRPGGLVDNVAGAVDVYGSTMSFLAGIGPPGSENYAWDWRKSPEPALAGLDEAVERARCGGTLPAGASTCANPVSDEVVIMAHSMGGLVTRWYLEDPARAQKVARVLTVGTPYWGAPKAFFPLASGAETPAAIGELDFVLDDEDFKEWARNASGEYFLWPSEAYGSWLTVAGHDPVDVSARADLLAYVQAELGGTSQLLAQALDAHAAVLDGFEAHGTDYRVVAGAGIPTIGKVRWLPGATPLLDRVLVSFTNGDATVPLRSAAQGATGAPLGEPVPIHYACDISHVPLPGAAPVTGQIEDFLLNGGEIGPGLPTTPAACPAVGSMLEVFNIGLTATTSRVRVRAAQAPAEALTLEDAERRGLIQLLAVGAMRVVVADADRPVVLKVSGRRFGLRATGLVDETQGTAAWFGPLDGEYEIRMGAGVEVRKGGVALQPGKPDTAAPATSVDLRRSKGGRLALKPRIKGGGTALIAVGDAQLAPADRLEVAARKVPRVRYLGVDAFGNATAERTLLAATKLVRKGRRLKATIACPAARTPRCAGGLLVKAGKRTLAKRSFKVPTGKRRTVALRSKRRARGKLTAIVRTGKRLESRLRP